MTIAAWIQHATQRLKKAGVSSSQLDSELLLTHVLHMRRTELHRLYNRALTSEEKKIADSVLELREKRIPLAYIIGHKEFYKRLFKVTLDTLIPRPETEIIVEELIRLNKGIEFNTVLDVGTGSGALAITVKKELPECRVIATDISEETLTIAKQNARHHNVNLTFILSDLLENISLAPDIIVANLPYVDTQWCISPEAMYEPKNALYTTKRGLHLIKKLLTQIIQKKWHCILLLEADPRQHNELIDFAQKNLYTHVHTTGLIVILKN
jgi:release factor glutamine methyltransferase